MEQKTFAPGELIFREGDPGDKAYLVASGAVEISKLQDGKDAVLGEIRPGSMFGEMALVGDKPRSATARAKDVCTLYIVPRQVFESELNGTSALMRAMVHNLMSHIRSLMAQLDAARVPPEPEVIIHKAKSFKDYKRS